jgi:hypothetical protein
LRFFFFFSVVLFFFFFVKDDDAFSKSRRGRCGRGARRDRHRRHRTRRQRRSVELCSARRPRGRMGERTVVEAQQAARGVSGVWRDGVFVDDHVCRVRLHVGRARQQRRRRPRRPTRHVGNAHRPAQRPRLGASHALSRRQSVAGPSDLHLDTDFRSPPRRRCQGPVLVRLGALPSAPAGHRNCPGANRFDQAHHRNLRQRDPPLPHRRRRRHRLGGWQDRLLHRPRGRPRPQRLSRAPPSVQGDGRHLHDAHPLLLRLLGRVQRQRGPPEDERRSPYASRVGLGEFGSRSSPR